MGGEGWYHLRRIVQPDLRESLLQSFSLFLTSFHWQCTDNHHSGLLSGWFSCLPQKPPWTSKSNSTQEVQAFSRQATVMLITATVILALVRFPLQALEMIKVLKFSRKALEKFQWRFILPSPGLVTITALWIQFFAIFSGNYRHELYRSLCWGASSKDSKRAPVVNECATRRMRNSSLAREKLTDNTKLL